MNNNCPACRFANPQRHGCTCKEYCGAPNCKEEEEVRGPRRWLYGLTADEWFHIASEGERSELPPCCGNIGALRDQLRTMLAFQGEGEAYLQQEIGKDILVCYETDGDGHNLTSRDSFPLLHRVLDGIRAQLQEGLHAR